MPKKLLKLLDIFVCNLVFWLGAYYIIQTIGESL